MECDRNGDHEGRIQKTLKSGYNQRRFHKQLENGNHKGFIQKEIELSHKSSLGDKSEKKFMK